MKDHRSGPKEVVAAFNDRYQRAPTIVVRAPGRVNLLGAHIDYNEGWVITGAIDRAVWLAAAPAETELTRITGLNVEDSAGLDLEHLPPPVDERGAAAGWVDYPAGIAWALQEAGHRPTPIDAVYGGDVPMGAGVSSSAAVEMAFLLAWERMAGPRGFGLDGAARTTVGVRAENGYLGVQSGIMDQYSSLHGARDRLVFLDCRHLTHELLPLPPNARVLVADTGVRRRLVDLNYNDRRAQCQEALAVLQQHLPNATALRDVTPRDFELTSHHLPMELRRRARHAVEECQRTRSAAAALGHGDLAAFGALMRQSHLSSRDLYEVSIPELDVLAASAWGAEGCHGARLTGAGFGGCVTVLCDAAAVDAVKQAMADAFEGAFDRRPEVFECAVADGAAVL
ncbi:MAG: galactokinase [Acidobacteriota bacterium]